MQRGARLARRLLGVMPPSVGPKKRQTVFKNIGLAYLFGVPLLGTHLFHPDRESVLMQCGARSFFCQSAPMQRGEQH